MQIAWHKSLTFGQLTVGKIIKIVATRCQILRLKCIKFNFWGSLQRSPRLLAGLRGPTSKGRGGDGMGRGERMGWGREGMGRKGEGRRRDPTLSRPLIHISEYAPVKVGKSGLQLLINER